MRFYVLFGLLLTASFHVCAQAGRPVSLFPQLWNMGGQLQVQIYNTTDKDVSCQGPVYMHTQKGQFKSDYYSDIIYRRMSSSRHFYLFDFSDRIVSYSHSIFCHER